jgi:hypothetical protein
MPRPTALIKDINNQITGNTDREIIEVFFKKISGSKPKSDSIDFYQELKQ